MIRGGEEPAGVGADQLVVEELEFRQKLVAVGLVEWLSSVSTVDFVFVIMVVSVVFSGSGFGESVGIVLFRFVEDDELRGVGRLSGFAEVSPKAGLVDEITSTVIKIAPGFAGNLFFPHLRTRLRSHISWAGY